MHPPTFWRALYLLWWTNHTIIFNCDTRVTQNGIHFDFMLHVKQPPNQNGSHPRGFVSFVPIWWLWWVITGKLGVDTYTHGHTQWHMDGRTDRRRQRQYPGTKTGLGQKQILMTNYIKSLFSPILITWYALPCRQWIWHLMACIYAVLLVEDYFENKYL